MNNILEVKNNCLNNFKKSLSNKYDIQIIGKFKQISKINNKYEYVFGLIIDDDFNEINCKVKKDNIPKEHHNIKFYINNLDVQKNFKPLLIVDKYEILDKSKNNFILFFKFVINKLFKK